MQLSENGGPAMTFPLTVEVCKSTILFFLLCLLELEFSNLQLSQVLSGDEKNNESQRQF